MTATALGLVLAAAVIHATWNLLAKRVAGGAAFLWLFDALSVLIYAPLVAVLVIRRQPELGAAELTFIVGTGLLHIAYFLLLQRGYRSGDLSLVYPLARGTGPLVATAVAIALFGERPGPLALAGAIAISVCAFVIAGGAGHADSDDRRWAIVYGLLTGATIAAYTIWDKYAVAVLLVSPLLYEWGGSIVRVILLAPLAGRRWAEVRWHWRRHRLEALGIATLAPLGYLLVLTALVFAPVSYVAPAREVSILIGAAMGARLLAEGHVRRRLVAAAGMVVGIVVLSLA